MSFYQVLIIVSLILWILLSSVAIIGLLLLLPRLLRLLRQLDGLHGAFYEKALAVLERADGLLDEISVVMTSVSDDIDRVDRTVVRATESVESMIELAEDRVSEINALIEVAVEEAEETFFSTAAILRALRPRGRSRKRRKLPRGERRRLG